MQGSRALAETAAADTVGEEMEKPRQATNAKPNAAKRSDVDRVKNRIANVLKMDFHGAVKEAGLGRATGFRFLDGTASVGSLAKLEEWVVKQEIDRGLRSSDAQARAVEEWANIGDELSRLDFADFEDRLAALRDYLIAKKKLTEATRRLGRLVSV